MHLCVSHEKIPDIASYSFFLQTDLSIVFAFGEGSELIVFIFGVSREMWCSDMVTRIESIMKINATKIATHFVANGIKMRFPRIESVVFSFI